MTILMQQMRIRDPQALQGLQILLETLQGGIKQQFDTFLRTVQNCLYQQLIAILPGTTSDHEKQETEGMSGVF